MWTSSTNVVKDYRDPLTYHRIYRYRFSEGRWPLRIYRRRVEIPLNFSDQLGNLPYRINGTNNLHQHILNEPPFSINDQEIIPWAKEMITEGSAVFEFKVDPPWMAGSRSKYPVLTLRAKFTDPKMATLFKLTFGGR